MVGLRYDFLANPLGVVRSTFQEAVTAINPLPALDGLDWGAADQFRQFLFDDGRISDVPMLNAETIKWLQSKTLVRFRGMVQDMPGNEYYVGAYKDGEKWVTNKFDGNPCGPMDGITDTRIWERRLLYCVPVPGQNSWTQVSYEATSSRYAISMHPSREKRHREDGFSITDVDMVEIVGAWVDPPNNKKMRGNDANLELSDDHTMSSQQNTLGLYSVFGDEGTSFSCLIKVYDSHESDLKLNDVIEFVGIFTRDSELNTGENQKDDVMDEFCDDQLLNGRRTKAPCIDCVLYRKLAIDDFLVSRPLEVTQDVKRALRESFTRHLTFVLGNDNLAAEYLLLHLLSRVHSRTDTMPIGKLSLNLTGFDESMSIFGSQLKHALMNILPYTQYVTLTIHSLNSAQLASKKDYTTNRLVPGLLQLAEGSHLTIDETSLQTGILNSMGCENAELLKRLLELQKVEYDFTYYKMEMAADIQVLILSEWKSLIMPADLVLPFHPSKVECDFSYNEEILNGWRWYLGSMKSETHTIDPRMQKVVEDDLVAARQADRSLGTSDFSRWLTMGRLMSLSFGETCLNGEHWEKVKQLETYRKERLIGSLPKDDIE